MQRWCNGVLLALVACGYGLWFGVRVVSAPLCWLYRRGLRRDGA
jgi:hypothetical protein